MAEKYQHREIEEKWQQIWEGSDIHQAVDFSDQPKKYLLVEYPYPSGQGLHIGHAFTNTIGDVLARFNRMNGYNVLFPMGWDSFGLPTENSAIKLGIHPRKLTQQNTALFKKQNKSLGLSFDWSREIDTSDPNYYQWTQWLFLQFYKKGLAYKADTQVGWCPSCRIILANEEIVSGHCERCGSAITYRRQKQWLLKITRYADRLAKELDLVDYPEYVKRAQRDWIGRKEWVDITYQVKGIDQKIVVSTTRPDTNFGASFVVLAPEHPLLTAQNIPSKYWKDVERYIQKSQKKSELERLQQGSQKSGVFTGLLAVNPLNGVEMPIYVTDFVLMSVGTGAVVGVPGHDRRDFEFAQKFKLAVIRVVVGQDGDESDITHESQLVEGEGQVINSDFLNGLTTSQARQKIIQYLKRMGWGQKVVRYHLRDWIFSRQHYWGEPIPIVYCAKCGEVAVPDKDLPVKLPEVEKYQPTATGESPLADIAEWVNTSCPECGGPATRETDTMPNWAGSSWYYLRFIDPDNSRVFAEGKKLDYWQPVDCYIGGAEHTTLHLLYSRFWHKFLNDLNLVPGKEPYASRRQHGVILGEDGARMSKSRGNVISPQEMVDKFGADTLRLYLMFMGPYDSTMLWNTTGIEGMSRFVNRLWRLFNKASRSTKPSRDISIKLHQTIKKVTEDIQNFHYNTAIAQLMTFINMVEKQGIDAGTAKTLCLLLAPFTPHLSEEIWQVILGSKSSVHTANWPQYDPRLTKEERVIVIVQVNGKVRGQLELSREDADSQSIIEKQAKSDSKVQKWLTGRIKKTIFVPGKLINFVI